MVMEMTGKEWNDYFKGLDREHQDKILTALETLDADPMFRKAYGSDFKSLAFFIKCPLREPTIFKADKSENDPTVKYYQDGSKLV
jgi:hypothetical protein